MDCGSCEAEIESTDRYCPACRMPNMACSRIPRFGPPERELAPLVAPRVTGPGQRPCPRCTGGVRRRDRYCRSCGMDVSSLPPPPIADAPSGRWIGPGGRARDDYRPLRPATSVLRLVVGVIALTGVALAAVSVVVWRRLGGEVTMIALPNTSIDWAVLQSWLQGLAVVQLALLVVASVLMIRWTAQASHNVAKLRVGGHTIASVWATLGWLIPGVNLVLPRQVVVQLWRTADRTGDVDGQDWKRLPTPTVLDLWWICTLVALPTVLLAGTELLYVGQFPPVALVDIHNARSAFVLLAMAEGLLVFAAALFARVLGEITERQADRVAHLNRGAEVPEPVAKGSRPVVTSPARARARSWRRPLAVVVEPDPGVLVHAGLDGSPVGRY